MLTHDPWLVALSICVAFQGSFVGLSLARRIRSSTGTLQRALITSSALTLALAIWTMHFVGMLAAQLPVSVDFLVLPTLLSFLVSVLVVGFAVFFVGSMPASRTRLVTASLFMGGGIVSMHYIGMSALHASVHMTHDPTWVAISVIIGICASGFALWYGFREGAPRSLAISAVIMALAISAMHYTAMVGLQLHVHSTDEATMPALSSGLLAIIVSIVAFLVSGLFLLTLVPDRGHPAVAPLQAPAVEVESVRTDDQSTTAAPLTRPDQQKGDDPGRLGIQTPLPVQESPKALPVEKDGRRLLLDVGRLVAVQAQAHYTKLFDGETTWFCPLPISEVESLLDAHVFARVHRSHIINLERIASIKKAGDSDVVMMTGKGSYQAPVSRARRTWLRQQFERQSHIV